MNCIFSNSDCNGALKHRMPLAATEKSAAMCEYHWTLRQHDVRVAASTGCKCWEGYERVPGTKPCAPGSCRKKSAIIDPLELAGLAGALAGPAGIVWQSQHDPDARQWDQYDREEDPKRKALMEQMHQIFRGEKPNTLKGFDPTKKKFLYPDAQLPTNREWKKQLERYDAQNEEKNSQGTLTPDQIRSQIPALPRGFASQSSTYKNSTVIPKDIREITCDLCDGTGLYYYQDSDHSNGENETVETECYGCNGRGTIFQDNSRIKKEFDSSGMELVDPYRPVAKAKKEEFSGGASDGDTSWDEGGFLEYPANDYGRREDDPATESTQGLDQPIPPVDRVNKDKGVDEEVPSFEATSDDEINVFRTPGTPKTRTRDYVVDSQDRGAFQLITPPASPAGDRLDAEGQPGAREKSRGQRGIQNPMYEIAASKGDNMKRCAACGTDTCLGHEQESVNYMILVAHASDDHSSCHPDGCSSVGRSFHAHICTNCGGDTPCVGTRTASVCDTFDGFCKTCFARLSGLDSVAVKVDKKKMNKHRRNRNTGAPAATQAEVDRAMGAGHSFEEARKEVGPHRPETKAASIECEICGKPSFVCGCDKTYSTNSMSFNGNVKLADPGLHNITGPDLAQYLTTLLGTGVATVAVTSLFDKFKDHMTKKSAKQGSIHDIAHAFLQWTVDNPSAVAGITQGTMLGGMAKLYLNKLRGKGKGPETPKDTPPPATTQTPSAQGPYDQDSELIVREGDGSHTFFDVHGVPHQWHPGLQTRRGSEELPEWLKDAKKIISEDSGEETEEHIAPVIDLDARREEKRKQQYGTHPSTLGPVKPGIGGLKEQVEAIQDKLRELERLQSGIPGIEDLIIDMARAPRDVKDIEQKVLEDLSKNSEEPDTNDK